MASSVREIHKDAHVLDPVFGSPVILTIVKYPEGFIPVLGVDGYRNYCPPPNGDQEAWNEKFKIVAEIDQEKDPIAYHTSNILNVILGFATNTVIWLLKYASALFASMLSLNSFITNETVNTGWPFV